MLRSAEDIERIAELEAERDALAREARYHQQELITLVGRLREAKDERDALAAHVERLTRLWFDMDDCEAESDEQLLLMAQMHDAIRDHYNDTPAISIARQAEEPPK